VLTLVETSRHQKDGTQNQHGNHASGQKTATVASHEIHHEGSRKWPILRPKRIASRPSSNRALSARNLIPLFLVNRPLEQSGTSTTEKCYGEVLTTAIGFRPRGAQLKPIFDDVWKELVSEGVL
jgi:hypothetical protein